MKYKRTIFIAVIMSFTLILLKFSADSKRIDPKIPFETFPAKVNGWKGKKAYFESNVYDVLGVDDSILMNYTSSNNSFIQLYVGYYASQKEGDLIHSPKNCMPGSGWNIVESGLEKVKLADRNKEIKVIKLKLRKGNQHQIVLYWFQSRGRIISSEYMQKIWLVIDSITRRRTDGSFVRIISPVINSEEKTLETMKAFSSDIYPYLEEYIPS